MDQPVLNRVEFSAQIIDDICGPFDGGHCPGIAVGIALAGIPVYRRGFGLAHAELPILLSPTMRMRLFSVSKQFTCLAFMLLCEEGRTSLDQPIGETLAGLAPAAARVTARQLMGNLSGLRDSHDINWVFSGTGQHLTSDDFLSFYRTIDDVNCAPGEAWIYNNGGFLLVSALVEQFSGQALEDVLRERIFAPIGMNDTLLRRVNTDFVANSATLHMTKPGGGFHKAYLGGERSGEGGIVSTVDDMLRWLAHMSNPIVGSAESWQAITTPQTLANGCSTGYGFGMFAGMHAGHPVTFHSGGGMGGNAFLLKMPAAGIDLIVMSNRYDVDSAALAQTMLDRLVPPSGGGPKPVQANAPMPAIEGVFQSPATGRVVQLAVKDREPKLIIDNAELAVVPERGGTLKAATAFGFLKQSICCPDGSTDPIRLVLDDFGVRDTFERAAPPRADPKPIEGRYAYASTDTILSVTKVGDGWRSCSTASEGPQP